MSSLAFKRVLHSDADAQALYAVLKSNRTAMANKGTPLQVVVSTYKAKRRDVQNNLMWAWLGQMATQAWIAGHQFSDETWNIQMKRDLLPDLSASGKEKWALLPGGERELAMSTTDLNVTEMAEYLTQLEAYAVTELGVLFAPNPNEYQAAHPQAAAQP